jgi:collagenase-like PrtC family protease
MKILAPVRSSDEVEPLLAAGADELYCGITPPRWSDTQGASWANRRNPRSAGVPDLDDLQRIVALAASRPVFVTLNSPAYRASAIPLLLDFGKRLLEEVGVRALIVAELELLLALAEAGLTARVHLSSLATCRNRGAALFYRDLGVSRIILPRHLTLSEIEELRVPGVELEAFVLNDGCVFEEGLCATTHALGTFCLADAKEPEQPTATSTSTIDSTAVRPEPFDRLRAGSAASAEAEARSRRAPTPTSTLGAAGPARRAALPILPPDAGAEIPAEARERYAFWKWTLDNCGCRTSRGFPLGPCGVCAIPRLEAAGVASLKVVGREASLQRKEGSVKLVAHAMRAAAARGGPEAIRDAVVGLRGARGLCEAARLCYYPDVWRVDGRARGRRAC